MYRQHQENIGYFVEKEHKHEFTYRLTTNPWALEHGFKHECDLGSIFKEVRFCNVKKTRVDMCLYEDDYGKPVVYTWVIIKNVVFVK